MRKFGTVLTAAAALSLVAAPAAAQERVASPVEDSEQLAGGTWLIALIALAGLIALVSDNNDVPTSP